MSKRQVPVWAIAVNAIAGLTITAVIAAQFLGGHETCGDCQTAITPSEEAVSEETLPVEEDVSDKAVAAVTKARLLAADGEPGSWMSHGRTYSEQRYSPLNDITADNAQNLKLAWSYDTGTTRGLEATPLMVDGVLYTTGNWGVVIALDAKTGEELWSFDPEVPGEWGRYGCCDIVNRGVAVWDGRVYSASFDGRLFALDAKTGEPIWEVNTIPGPPYTITGAPRIVNGKVIIG
ncbi:MAG: glucose dehydrogenase, partial [Parvibaculaceae bacterium]